MLVIYEYGGPPAECKIDFNRIMHYAILKFLHSVVLQVGTIGVGESSEVYVGKEEFLVPWSVERFFRDTNTLLAKGISH